MPVGRHFFGDDFVFPQGLVCIDIVPVALDSPFYVGVGRGGMPTVGYFLLDVAELGDAYTATFLPYFPGPSWDDGAMDGVGFLNPNAAPNFHHTFWPHLHSGGPARLEFPDEETRMGTVWDGDVDFWDYLYLIIPQEQLGTITVTFQRAADGRMIAVSSRYDRYEGGYLAE